MRNRPRPGDDRPMILRIRLVVLAATLIGNRADTLRFARASRCSCASANQGLRECVNFCNTNSCTMPNAIRPPTPISVLRTTSPTPRSWLG